MLTRINMLKLTLGNYLNLNKLRLIFVLPFFFGALYGMYTYSYNDINYTSGMIILPNNNHGIFVPFEKITGWNYGFQFPATPIMNGIILFHNHLMFLVICIVILIFFLVFKLKNYIVAFHLLPHQRKPAIKFSHASLIEILWTLFPTVILIIISVPSFALLYAIDAATTPDLTVKTIAHQWYWSYEYGDFSTWKNHELMQQESVEWDCYILSDKQVLKLAQYFKSPTKLYKFTRNAENKFHTYSKKIPAYQRLLFTDKYLSLPTRQHIRLIVTSSDVLHSWAIPAFGVKVDAVPGRLNQIYFYILRDGYFFGQCSEICGINHGFMPIVIDAIPLHKFILKVGNFFRFDVLIPLTHKGQYVHWKTLQGMLAQVPHKVHGSTFLHNLHVLLIKSINTGWRICQQGMVYVFRLLKGVTAVFSAEPASKGKDDVAK